jgi:hypothetical protein
VHAALELLLQWDTRLDLPARMPRIPPFFRPEALTRPLLKNGKRLPLSALAHLGTMLSFSEKRFPYAGITDVKAACEPRSLAEFAWDLARSWEMAGSKSASEWMLDALIHFADDEVVRRTTPTMRSQAVGEVLQVIGTDSAVLELVTIGARAASGNKSYGWASTAVDRRIERIAAERGLSGDELEDAVLPLSEVDYKKGFQLDYGPRMFEVRFDERLEAFIVDVGEEGTKLRTPPPARKTDDKQKVEEAKRLWQDLREEVSAVVARRLVRLESAMIRGKTWTPSELVRRYVAHPLLGHIGRAFVWEQAGKTFRVTEDGAFADVADHPLTLDPGTPVRLAHPARMQDDEAETWRQLFFDYRIVQPFLQLGRAARPLTTEELAARVFVRTPKDLANEDFSRRLSERGYAGGKKRLSRGEAHVVSTYLAKHVTKITLKLLPPFADFDPVEMAEAVSDIDF